MFSESDYVGNFLPHDGALDFYLRCRSLIGENDHVLDIGAGRAAWYEDDPSLIRRDIRALKNVCRQVTAADIDPVVLGNRASDRQLLIENHRVPAEDHSFDLIIADWVLEHVQDPVSFATEIDRLLKPGGWFCARTPHRYHYVALAAQLVPNSLHKMILSKVQPHKKGEDVFPTCYKMNSFDKIQGFFFWLAESIFYLSWKLLL